MKAHLQALVRALARRFRFFWRGFRRHRLARRELGAIAVKQVDQIVDDTPRFSKHGIFADFLDGISLRGFSGVLTLAIADDDFLINPLGFCSRGSVAI